MKKLVGMLLLVAGVVASPGLAGAKEYVAYISDSPSGSSIFWMAKEAGIYKKHGLDLEMIYINGSVRGIQS
ncbi:MAG: ABC transporter substrate-binding protein, partial [Deltaproteobacteria bacterium]|nr:ABC transporter substrate-binding protein [Deltaproteobacteria bacterium]